MESFNEGSLSAYFPGLVDVCVNEDGELVYLIVENGELVITKEYNTETESFSIPERKHFPFELPRVTEVLRHFHQEDYGLYDDVIKYLKRFSALDDEQWAIVAHYVFLTYLHDHPAIDYCPYLLFNAVPERGKSRTGKSIIYISFRGIHLVELREANIFRYSQHLHGTLFFDLMDISKKAQRNNCDDILLLRFEKGAKCARVLHPELGAFNDTEYYLINGPTIISSNKQLDDILETRCLPITMPNRPGNYENPRPELGLELKERLTAWRAKYLCVELCSLNPIAGISGRLWDITKPLFLISSLLPVDYRILEKAILAIAGDKDESRKGTVEGRLVAIIRDITNEEGFEDDDEWSIRIKDILSKYNQDRPEDKQVTSQWIGRRLKSMSFRKRIVKGYSEILINRNEYQTILRQYGYLERDISNPSETLPEKDEQIQDVLKEVESGRESAQTNAEFDFTSPSERECYEELLDEMKNADRMSEEEKRNHAYNKIQELREHDEVPF